MRRAAGGRLLAGLCALATVATLAACPGGVDDGPDHVHAAATSVPAPSPGTSQATAGSVPGAATGAAHPSLQSVAERWEQHPDEAPEGVQDSGLLLNQRAQGPQTIALPDLRGSRKLVMTIACAPENDPFTLRLEDADGKDFYWMSSACPGGSSATTPPLDPADPPTAIRVEVPEGTGYYVTVYGIS